MRLACFVSAHGFGHATRTRAVLDALTRAGTRLDIELFTAAPAWVFEDIDATVALHAGEVDPGPAQLDAFEIDVGATLVRLAETLPFTESRIEALAARLRQRGCEAVLCDISPLGLMAARRAGVPGVLLENFTWDWIFAGMGDDRLAPYVDYLGECFDACRWRISATPHCGDGGDIIVPPVSRRRRHDRGAVRSALGVAEHESLVLVSLGGTPHRFDVVARLAAQWPRVRFLVAGGVPATTEANVIALDGAAPMDHPSLAAAADAVVGKAGYSTVAEVYAAGVPFACFTRPGFAESPVLARFVAERMPSMVFPGERFDDGGWAGRLDELLAFERADRTNEPDGAEAAARFLLDRLRGNGEAAGQGS